MKLGSRHLALLIGALAALVVAACGHKSSGSSTTTGTTTPTPSGDLAWTYVAGGKAVGQTGIYGSLGVPAATNLPGSRDSAATWTDASGVLWLFGGTGYDVSGSVGSLNDLWKYDPAAQRWTWVATSSAQASGQVVNAAGNYGTKGQASASTVPGARAGAVSWVDVNGNLWLFGGIGFDANKLQGDLNDLWMFSPASGQWTWVGGANTANAAGIYAAVGSPNPASQPGGREGALAWTDPSGKFWLYGGGGYDSAGNNGTLSDLWQYDPTTGVWTVVWVATTTPAFAANPAASYGTQGTAGGSPGPRQEAAGWIDTAGNLWVFGGLGLDSKAAYGYLNDLWMYSPHNKNWTWVGGSSTISVAGVYGTLGTAATTNIPGSRAGASAFVDAKGNFRLFGGQGFGSGGSQGYLNDVWEYAPTAKTWKYVSGATVINATGVYGTQGTAAKTNSPGGRYYTATWYDKSGQLWLFGGGGYDSKSVLGQLNDLWMSKP